MRYLLHELENKYNYVDFNVEEDKSIIVIHHNYTNDGSLDSFNETIANLAESYSNKAIVISYASH